MHLPKCQALTLILGIQNLKLDPIPASALASVSSPLSQAFRSLVQRDDLPVAEAFAILEGT